MIYPHPDRFTVLVVQMSFSKKQQVGSQETNSDKERKVKQHLYVNKDELQILFCNFLF